MTEELADEDLDDLEDLEDLKEPVSERRDDDEAVEAPGCLAIFVGSR